MKNVFLILICLLFASCGTPKEVKEAFDRYESATIESIQFEREAMENEVTLLEALRPLDEAARTSKARLELDIMTSQDRRKELMSVRLETLRKIGSYIKSPGLLGSDEDQARFDERLKIILDSLKGKKGEVQ